MHRKDFPSYAESLLNSIFELTSNSKYLSTSDVAFYRSDLTSSQVLDNVSEQLLAIVNQLGQIGSGDNNMLLFDNLETYVDENYSVAVDLIDNLLERAVCYS